MLGGVAQRFLETFLAGERDSGAHTSLQVRVCCGEDDGFRELEFRRAGNGLPWDDLCYICTVAIISGSVGSSGDVYSLRMACCMVGSNAVLCTEAGIVGVNAMPGDHDCQRASDMAWSFPDVYLVLCCNLNGRKT